VLIITVVYLFPGMAAVAAQPDIGEFKSGCFTAISRLLPHCENGWLSVWISISGVCGAVSLLNAALSCSGRETYASALVGAFPFGWPLARLDPIGAGDPLPIRALLFMSILTIPLCFFNFGLLVSWTGSLSVMSQCMQVVTFITVRRGHSGTRNPPIPTEPPVPASAIQELPLHDRNAPDQLLVPTRGNGLAGETNLAHIASDREMEGKFIIPGGTFGAALACSALGGISLTVLAFRGWKSLLMACLLVGGMYCLKGLELLWRASMDPSRSFRAHHVLYGGR
jgi:hypothetical protein